MALEPATTNSDVAILSRVIEPEAATLSPEAARSLLRLDFHRTDHERMEKLAAQARAGTLSEQERVEIDNYNHVGHLLALLQAKARRSLKQAGFDS